MPASRRCGPARSCDGCEAAPALTRNAHTTIADQPERAETARDGADAAARARAGARLRARRPVDQHRGYGARGRNQSIFTSPVVQVSPAAVTLSQVRGAAGQSPCARGRASATRRGGTFYAQSLSHTQPAPGFAARARPPHPDPVRRRGRGSRRGGARAGGADRSIARARRGARDRRARRDGSARAAGRRGRLPRPAALLPVDLHGRLLAARARHARQGGDAAAAVPARLAPAGAGDRRSTIRTSSSRPTRRSPSCSRGCGAPGPCAAPRSPRSPT